MHGPCRGLESLEVTEMAPLPAAALALSSGGLRKHIIYVDRAACAVDMERTAGQPRATR